MSAKMSPSDPDALTWQHYVVAQVARAAVGLISDDVVGLAVEISADAVVLHAALARQTDEVRDDLDHICFELDVLLDGHVAITHTETVLPERPWPPAIWHPVYVAKRESHW
jgi:hypothetical protein